MNQANNQIIKSLSERGYRITGARKEISTVILAAKEPLTIQDLVDRVFVDEASVYRTVETLKKENLIEEILLKNERPRYASSHDHHHHVVCSDCGYIAHIACDVEPDIPKSVKGFKCIDSHELTFYGLCSNCC